MVQDANVLHMSNIYGLAVGEGVNKNNNDLTFHVAHIFNERNTLCRGRKRHF